MLLTLKPPVQNGIKGPHEYSIVRQSIPTPRSSTSSTTDRPSTPGPSKRSTERAMDASRRGLPPPSSMTLPPQDPGLSAAPPAGQLPPPPPQWQNADESMRQWLQAKAEDDRRRQEEEKTRQESLKLEQRRIEQSMLQDALRSGVPPYMVPLIFAGIGGGNLPSAALDFAQHYMAQMNIQSQQQHYQPPPPSQHSAAHPQPSLAPPPPPPQPPAQQHQPLQPEVRRDNRTIPPNPYGAQQTAPPAVPASPPQHSYGRSQQSLLHGSSAHGSPADLLGSSTAPLSRINTAEIHIHHPPANVGVGQYPTGPAGPPPPPPVKQESQQQQQSSPSICFHHWVPPGQSQPNTPSGKSQHESPLSSHPHSHLRSEYQSSPGRKRKAQGSHPPAPPPSSQVSERSSSVPRQSPQQTPPGGAGRPTNSHGHLRQRSDAGVHESRYQDRPEPERPSGQTHARSISGSTAATRGPNPEGDQAKDDRRRASGGASAGARNPSIDESQGHMTLAPSAPQSHQTEGQPHPQSGQYSAYPRSQNSASSTTTPAAAPPPASETNVGGRSGSAQSPGRPRGSI